MKYRSLQNKIVIFDTIWKYVIIQNLVNVGVKSRLAIFIQNFYHDRQSERELVTIYHQEFSEKAEDITKCISVPVTNKSSAS